VNISDEAVEAAMTALDNSWVTDASREQLVEMLKYVLEAAAPHMLAEAWDAAVIEGESCGWLHDYATNDLRNRNPYRNQT
jgi:hypothetical protein